MSRLRSRRFVDRSGEHWQVLEAHVNSRAVVGMLAARADAPVLYFMSRRETRRAESFPVDWARLPAPALADLCACARPVGGAPRRAAGEGSAQMRLD